MVGNRVEGVWFGIAGALEQETWSSVQVPSDSQHLVQDWADCAGQLKAAYTSPAKRASSLSNGDKSPPGEQQRLGAGCPGAIVCGLGWTHASPCGQCTISV